MERPAGILASVRRMRSVCAELLAAWAKTDVDRLAFADDWGSRRSLLISPAFWREYFRPMCRGYAQIAHGASRRIFMRAGGCVLDIYPGLIEIGVGAVNSRLLCMGAGSARPLARPITFWFEIDRRHLLPFGTPARADSPARGVHAALWRCGGCIAQCESGAAAKPGNARQVFATCDAPSPRAEKGGGHVGV